MRTKLILFFILFFLRLDVFSQMIQNEIIVPPNLTANKLENCNIDKPNLYSGTLDDNIPIYEIKIKNFSLPISLNHNYNGFKPAESASWVGLGWNLRVGGSISRIINNRPDENPSGYMSIADILNIPDPVNATTAFNSFTSNLTKDQLKSFAEGWWDGLPDEYMLSANDINAKFIQLRNGNYATIPFKPIKISNLASDQWMVLDESGNKYYFGKLTNNDIGIEQSSSTTTVTPDTGGDISSDATTKYMLRKIELITGEIIVFNYELETVWYDSATSETKNYPMDGNYNSSNGNQNLPFQQYCSTNTYHTFCRLTSIETPYEKIYFKAGILLRKDLHSTNSYPLGEIEVKNSTNNTVKGWLFYPTYMGNTASYTTCRLMLDSIVEYGTSQTNHKPAYSFSYENSSSVPSYTSMSIDHWGYYNGANNNTLIPKNVPNSNYNDLFVNCGDREPNHNYSKIGLLTQVKLPTKGSLSYQYEPNSYSSVNNAPVTETIDDPITIYTHVTGTGNMTKVVKTITITKAQSVSINYSLQAYPNNNNGTWSTDQDPVFIRITQNSTSTQDDAPSTQDDYSKTNAVSKITGTVTKYLRPGTYYIVAAATYTYQFANIDINYIASKKDSNGNIINQSANKLTGGHRVNQLIKQNDINDTNTITQTLNYTCGSAPTQSSGVLVNTPDYECINTVMNVDYSSAIPHQLPDVYYIARTSNSLRSLVSDDSHINYSEVTSIINQNTKNISYFTSGKEFADITFPRNAANISQSYKRGLLIKDLQFKNTTQQIKSVDYNYNFLRAENKNGMGGIYLVEYLHKNIAPELSTYKAPWCGKIISEWIPLESTVEQIDGVSTTNNYYYDNPVHAQITRTKVDNTQETYTYTLYSDDYSNTGTGNFIGEMKTAHIMNKPIEKITYIKDKISGSYYITSGEIYTYKVGSHLGQIESVYKLKTQTPIALSSFKFSNRTISGETPHVNNTYTTFSVANIDTRYNTEPEQKVLAYDFYNNPLEIWNKDNTSTTYLWSYNYQYPIAEIKNATYAEVKTALGYDDTQIETLAANTAPAVSSIRALLASYFKDKAVLVTAYTYKPLVGIQNATTPNGIVTTYEYDDFNRMKQAYIIENGEKKILQKNDYHYSNQ